MARLARLFAHNQPQHIIHRCKNHLSVFQDETDCLKYLAFLGDAINEHKFALHAYILMSNHVHLLGTPEQMTTIPKVMQSVGRRYAHYFNEKTARTGTLWEGRYKSTLADQKTYLLLCSRYIELNPVRMGVVESPDTYPWSSYRHHVGLRSDPLITDHAQYWALGNTPFERQAAYLALFDQNIGPEQLALIRNATNKGWALGTEDCVALLQSTTPRRLSPLPKGRPLGSKTHQPG